MLALLSFIIFKRNGIIESRLNRDSSSVLKKGERRGEKWYARSHRGWNLLEIGRTFIRPAVISGRDKRH